jgi:hypothetical protein|tara:strand:+ start:29 stop:292 length:264 start_codon:yes stop_codon:yes gene_type:complete
MTFTYTEIAKYDAVRLNVRVGTAVKGIKKTLTVYWSEELKLHYVKVGNGKKLHPCTSYKPEAIEKAAKCGYAFELTFGNQRWTISTE